LLEIQYYDGLDAAFDLRNLNPAPQPKRERGKGDVFDVMLAKRSWQVMESMMTPGRLVICAGRSVASIAGVGKLAWFEHSWELNAHGAFEITVIPHPSGISHWWNDPQNVRRARAYLRAVIEHR
jgi:hypothetical protein